MEGSSGSGGTSEHPSSGHDTVLREFLPLPYQSLTTEGEIVEVNERWLELLGYERGTVEGEAFGQFLTPDSRERFKQVFEAFKSSGEVSGVDLQLRDANGHAVSVSCEGRIEHDDQGGIVRTHWQFSPTGPDETGGEGPSGRTVVPSSLLENMPMGVYAEDGNRMVVAANQQFCDLFGFSDSCDDLVDRDGTAVAETVKDRFEDPEGFVERIDELVEARERVLAEEFHMTDGRILSCSYIPYARRSVERNLWLYRDVTERNERERELRRKNERLDEFATVVSHDLRNPLNVAQGRAALLEETCENEHVEGLVDALARMEAIIEDTLILAYQGQSVGDLDWIDASTLLGNCWSVVDTAEAEYGIDDTFEVHGEPDRLQHLFENLIRNAVEHGGEDVSIHAGSFGDGGIYFEDDGPGIPKAERTEVFDPGYTTAADGTGFGLTIVRRIAEAHGWEISVAESDAGGARFEFTGADIR